ncbi:hypothetical protein JYU10_00150 [bacterium AH-315-J04]|nr:hypothetical protein [bacterium AH-315-J04]
MASKHNPSQGHPVGSNYKRLVERFRVPDRPKVDPESELDQILNVVKQREAEKAAQQNKEEKPDAIQQLRLRLTSEFIPVFVELMDKYKPAGVSMDMDASNFLEGGREIRFCFGYGEYRLELLGTVTSEAIAFHETQYSPDVRGQLASGPMLRLRRLDSNSFREFVCNRISGLLKSSLRQREITR